jgi:arsenate reductase
MKRILFVCVENANRSQMAEAFARLYGQGVVEAYSAGSRPAQQVNPRARAAMLEKGCDLSAARPKSLTEIPQGPYEYVITMACGDACPWIPAAHREDWALSDPRDLPPQEFNLIRDDIERRVACLIERIRAQSPTDLSVPPADSVAV